MMETTERDESRLAALAAQIADGKGGPAPVERWDPPDCGAIDIAIAADGRWFHEGTVIAREPLVRLFASILRRDADGETYLVTPVEKLRIAVEDAHFLAVEMIRTHEDGEPLLTFRTNLAGLVAADAAHPLRLPLDPEGEFRPYLTVRGNLEARLTRSVAIELADFVEEDAGGLFIRSGGARFAVPSPDRPDASMPR